MPKDSLGYYGKVGFHLLLIGIAVGLVTWLLTLPIHLALGATVIWNPAAFFAGIGALSLIQTVIGVFLAGYLVVKYWGWVSSDSLL